MAVALTRDHEAIRGWARSRGCRPVIVSRTGGMLRLDFSPPPASSPPPDSWDEFFRIFDENRLALVFDDQPASRVHKFILPAPDQDIARLTSRPRPAAPGKKRGRRLANAPAQASV